MFIYFKKLCHNPRNLSQNMMHLMSVFLWLGSNSAKRPSAATAGSPTPTMTSGNESEAPTVMGSTPQNGENKPPQAIVKPQVLTHVIEGFVIQEGAEPFPVCVSSRGTLGNPEPTMISGDHTCRELTAGKLKPAVAACSDSVPHVSVISFREGALPDRIHISGDIDATHNPNLF